ncbi:MAG: serine/threonine-protein kinase, partial [Myxococcota bacterium]
MSEATDTKDYKYVGKTVGNVSVRSVIAEGGMGVIYLGEQALTQRKVAVKILRPERQRSRRDREYFLREAKALSQVRHPYLLELYTFGTTEDGEYYMVLEYVPGRTLRQVVEQEGVLSPLRCVHLFRQLLLALEATHAHGILHRDLKPDNLLIEELSNSKERLRLADLGLVKFTRGNMRPLTEVGMTVGTPCYMSPEQVRGKRLDARSDLYSTGVLMFEALTSYLPYPKAPNIDKLLDHILDSKPAKLIRADPKFKRFPGLQRLLDQLLAKKAAHRPSSAAEVIAIFDRLLETELAEALQKAKMERREQDPALMSRTLLTDAAQMGQQHDTHTTPSFSNGPSHGESVPQGVVIAFMTGDRHSGEKVSPTPRLLQGLRA